MERNDLPVIIQGGMGLGVSSWNLAKMVSNYGKQIGLRTMGVISGVGLGFMYARRLQDGDIGGHIRRAFDAFPYRNLAERVWKLWYSPNGRNRKNPYKGVRMANFHLGQDVSDLTVISNFAEVWLAKEGHSNPIGVNYLGKVETPHLPSIFGAMLAEVDVVIMGAGIPYQIPGILSKFSECKPATYFLEVAGANQKEFPMTFDPQSIVSSVSSKHASLKKPFFFPIVASDILARYLSDPTKSTGEVDGFIIENAYAGGHNAPPRGPLLLTEEGEPIYGERDIPNIEKLNDLGKPFWLAGGYSDGTMLTKILESGARGIQLGSVFALSEESGFTDDIKRILKKQAYNGALRVFQDPVCSPSGYPFNVAQLPETMGESESYNNRTKICDVGGLRQAYKNPRGGVSFRCPSEPVDVYLRKGGKIEDTLGRKCLCNGLLAAIGLEQTRKTGVELPIVTIGRDLSFVRNFLDNEEDSYSVKDILSYFSRYLRR